MLSFSLTSGINAMAILLTARVVFWKEEIRTLISTGSFFFFLEFNVYLQPYGLR